MTLKASHNVTGLQEEASGQYQLDLPDGETISPSGRPLAPVSRSRLRAKAEVLMMTGICGPTYFASPVPQGRLSLWENKLRARLAMVGSTELALIWREKVTPAGQSMSRLAPWTPPTSDKGCIGSPWPTPQARDGFPPHSAEYVAKHKANGHGMSNLNEHLNFTATWPTPTTRDWKDTGDVSFTRPDGKTRLDRVPMLMLATEVSGQTTNGLPATTEKRGAPNPVFACWLMGFPDEWVSGALRAMQSTPSSQRKS